MIELGARNSGMRPSEQSVAGCSRHVTAAALKHNLVQLAATLIYIFLLIRLSRSNSSRLLAHEACYDDGEPLPVAGAAFCEGRPSRRPAN